VIVRGEQAIPPRGSTRIEAGDRLHVLVRQEAAIDFHRLLERWRTGPIGRQRRERRPMRSTQAVHTTRPWSERLDHGEPSHPSRLGGVAVIDQLRTRRDGLPGALVQLEDGRYAVSGSAVIIGGSREVQDSARRKIRQSKSDAERAWWREVVGALAAPED